MVSGGRELENSGRVSSTLFPRLDYGGTRTPAATHKPKGKGSIYNCADLAKFAGVSRGSPVSESLTGHNGCNRLRADIPRQISVGHTIRCCSRSDPTQALSCF